MLSPRFINTTVDRGQMINNDDDGQRKIRGEDVGLMTNPFRFAAGVLESYLFRQDDQMGELAKILSWVSRTINDSMDATGRLEEGQFQAMTELFQYATNALEQLKQDLVTLKQEAVSGSDVADDDDDWSDDETVDETGIIADALFGDAVQGDEAGMFADVFGELAQEVGEEDLRKLCEEIDRKCAEASGSGAGSGPAPL
jgi:hypothetical protein